MPNNAPSRFKNRATLWNAVEQTETRKNSQTARHIDSALPVEISREEQIDLVRNFCQQNFISKGMCVDFAIHDKNDGNPHVHILLTTRRVDENGFTTKDRSWNDKGLLIEWRKSWADWCNLKLYPVSDERIDHRSYAVQGIDKVPQIHLGVETCAIEKKGFNTDKGSKNRRIKHANEKAEITRLESTMLELIREHRAVKRELIETKLQCPISDMVSFPASAVSDLDGLEKQLEEANISYAKVPHSGELCILINRNNWLKVDKMITPETVQKEQVVSQIQPKKDDQPVLQESTKTTSRRKSR